MPVLTITGKSGSEAVSDLPTRSVWAEAFCELEGHRVRAATVGLLVRDDPDLPQRPPFVFTLTGAGLAYGLRDFDPYLDSIWDLPDDTTVADQADAVRRADFDALRRLAPEFAPFWCRTCKRSYCRNHWDLT